MDEMTAMQELSLMSKNGREMLSKVVELVHVKLGNEAFKKLVGCSVARDGPEFFYQYLKFDWDTKADPVAQFDRIRQYLEKLPNHPDIRVFLS